MHQLLIAAALLIGSHSKASTTSRFTLPAPTGPNAIGTTDGTLIDPTRLDTLGGVTVARVIKVAVWYPAAVGVPGEQAPYLRNGPDEFAPFARLIKGPPAAFAHLNSAHSHAIVNAPVNTTRGKLPVILLSHGYLSSPTASTVVSEELASHGYLVLSITHTGEAQSVTLPDGRTIAITSTTGTLAARPAAVIGEWGAEDSTMAAVTRATTDADRARLMRGYLKSIPISTKSLARWVADQQFVVNEAFRRSRLTPTARAPLAGHIDTARLGAMGHSFGGVTAAEFCRVDPRCKAGLNLDGIPQYGAMLDNGAERPFLMIYSERQGRIGASDVIYRHSRAKYQSVVVAGTRHADLADYVLYGSVVREMMVSGPVVPAVATGIVRRVVREWFDQELRGRSSALLGGQKTVAGLRLRP